MSTLRRDQNFMIWTHSVNIFAEKYGVFNVKFNVNVEYSIHKNH